MFNIKRFFIKLFKNIFKRKSKYKEWDDDWYKPEQLYSFGFCKDCFTEWDKD